MTSIINLFLKFFLLLDVKTSTADLKLNLSLNPFLHFIVFIFYFLDCFYVTMIFSPFLSSLFYVACKEAAE